MSFITYLKKELLEYKRTSKFILPLLFLFFGMLSPVMAKFTNEILAMVGEQEGIKIILPDPTYIQSYEQLFKNFNSMLILVVILMFAGSVAEEKSKGTAVLMLTKCLTKTEFVLSKITGAIILFTLSTFIASIICIYYTGLLFKVFFNIEIIAGILLFWVFGMFIISMTFLGSILSKNYASAAVYGLVGFFAISAIGAIPYVKDYTPGLLQSMSMEIIKGNSPLVDSIIPVFLTLALSFLMVAAGIRVFKKQEI